jgi:hypothetical protein
LCGEEAYGIRLIPWAYTSDERYLASGTGRNGGTALNRLAKSKNPYLLQHAENPVDWYPWSDEAFEKAASLDKPIFLSIGYSTCHWCHVMAEESFEDEEVAKVLNDSYISIKVTRKNLSFITAQDLAYFVPAPNIIPAFSAFRIRIFSRCKPAGRRLHIP